MTLGVPAAPTLTAQYQFNQLRQLGSWSFAYNLNGERVGEQNAPDGNREYGYDGFGNLVWVRRNGQLVYEARYDALGRRVAYRTSNHDWDWVYLLYDGDMLVAELDAYGQVRAEYVWGSLGPVARIAGGRVQLYVCDALGHVRALIDAQTGQITDRYDYDAWGNVVHNGTTRQPFTWNGAYGYEWMPFAWDRASGYGDGWRSEVGLYHVGARAYDPRTARWLQRDPIDAASGDPNLYRYCGNDPVNYRDPTGTEIQDELSSVTCTRGKMEIVRMALEEARAAGTSIRETQ
jgi:RHS repeat-associated protein